MNLQYYPKMVVLDLDGTIWEPEMYQLSGGSPFRKNKNLNVIDRSGEEVHLLGDTRKVMSRHWASFVIKRYHRLGRTFA
jgi:magnesium-dependent phosphatase 1